MAEASGNNKPPGSETLIFDRRGNGPRHFRSPRDVPTERIISVFGLAGLNASGSAQFTRDELRFALAQDLPQSTMVVVVDLREEAHGFIHGTPVSWYADKNWINQGKSWDEVLVDEARRLEDLASLKRVAIYNVASKTSDGAIDSAAAVDTRVADVESEETLVTIDLKQQYLRLPVRDHCAPSVDVVNAFIEAIRGLDNQNDPGWLHFHCHGGDGRTTTFLAMYDMVRNAKKVAFEDIVNRHAMLGPVNLFHLGSGWKRHWAKERLRLVRCFYDYVRDDGYDRGKDFGKWFKPKAEVGDIEPPKV